MRASTQRFVLATVALFWWVQAVRVVSLEKQSCQSCAHTRQQHTACTRDHTYEQAKQVS